MEKKKIIKIVLILAVVIFATVATFFVVDIFRKDYKVISEIEYNYYNLVTNGKVGVIDKNGNIIIDAIYDNINIPNPEKPVFICLSNIDLENEKYVYKILNEKKEEIFTQYDRVEAITLSGIINEVPYEKTVLKYKKDNKWGLVNYNGKQVTKPIYTKVESLPYKEGEILVEIDGKLGVINSKGVTLIKPLYDKISGDTFYEDEKSYKLSGYIVSLKTDDGFRSGYINNKGQKILDIEYNDITRVVEVENPKLITLIVTKNGQKGVMHGKKIIIPTAYQSIEYSDDNRKFIVRKNKYYGIFDLDGKEILKTEYDSIQFKGTYIFASKETNIVIADENGKIVEDIKYISKVKTENDNYFIVQNDSDNAGVINAKGEEIVKCTYMTIDYIFDKYFIVGDSSGKYGIIDDTGKIILPIKYKTLQKINFSNILQGTLDNDEIELYSKNMETILNSKEMYIEVENEYVLVSLEKENIYFDLNGKKKEAKELFKTNKLFAKVDNEKWGFVDKDEKVIVDYKYSKVTEFNEARICWNL